MRAEDAVVFDAAWLSAASPIRRPKLHAFVSRIDHWLDEDLKVPRKQPIRPSGCSTGFVRSAGSPAATRSYKDYMRGREQRRQEVFVPLSHPLGHAQADFGEAMVVIGGVERKARFFFMLDLPHSDACYVRVYPAAVSEASTATSMPSPSSGPCRSRSSTATVAALLRRSSLTARASGQRYSCFASLSEAGTNLTMIPKLGARFTEKQGHYPAFIHTYAYMFGRPLKPTSSATSA